MIWERTQELFLSLCRASMSGRQQPCSRCPQGSEHVTNNGALRIYLRSPAQVQGTQGFLLRPEKDLESPSARLEARFPYHDSRAKTRSPSPCAWRPDFPDA